ncbi:hypothetical protein Ancab_008549 [Ancistrocladus abbreviatus]
MAHLFLQCLSIVPIWFLVWGIDNQALALMDTCSWLHLLLVFPRVLVKSDPLKHTLPLFIVVFLDQVLQLRNSVCFDNGIYTPDILIHKIRSNMNLWEAGFAKSSIGGHHYIPTIIPASDIKWNGEFLITVDVGTTTYEGYGSFMVRSPEFQFKLGEIIHFTTMDPLILEAQMILSAMQYAKQKQLRRVCLMGDNKVVIEAIQEKTQAPWRIAHIISHMQVE